MVLDLADIYSVKIVQPSPFSKIKGLDSKETYVVHQFRRKNWQFECQPLEQ